MTSLTLGALISLVVLVFIMFSMIHTFRHEDFVHKNKKKKHSPFYYEDSDIME